MRPLYPKLFSSLKTRCSQHFWLNVQKFVNPRTQLAVVTLFAVLQKSPAIVRSLNILKSSVNPATRIIQKITIAAASLGSYQAVSGATAFVVGTGSNVIETLNDVTIDINQNEEFLWGFGIKDTPENAQSWEISGQIPTGMIIRESNGTTEMNANGIINSVAGSLSGTPTEAGSFTFTIKPWDRPNGTGDTTSGIDITVNVIGANSVPILDAEIPDQLGEENFEFTLDLNDHFSDPDQGDSLSFSAEQSNQFDLPEWLQFNPQTGILTGTPAIGDIGTISVTVTASDGEESISDTFDLEVIAERIPEETTIAAEHLENSFRFSWSVLQTQSYQLEKSTDGIEWVDDPRNVVEADGTQTVSLTPSEVDQRILLRVETNIIR